MVTSQEVHVRQGFGLHWTAAAECRTASDRVGDCGSHRVRRRVQRGVPRRIGAGQARRAGPLLRFREPLPKGLIRLGQAARITIRIGKAWRPTQ